MFIYVYVCLYMFIYVFTCLCVGIYYHYLVNKEAKPKTWLQRWSDRLHRWIGEDQLDPTSCSKEEVRTGWREADMKNAASWIQKFIVKIKIWEQNSEVTYFGKKIKKKRGDWKRTFEIIQDHGGIYSYNIDHIPAYETIMMGVHEGTAHSTSMMESPRLSPRDNEDNEDGDVGLQGGVVSEKTPPLFDQNEHENDNDNESDRKVIDIEGDNSTIAGKSNENTHTDKNALEV